MRKQSQAPARMTRSLLALGAVFADEDWALGTVGLVALAQGIGPAVALVWLSAGHNPLSRR